MTESKQGERKSYQDASDLLPSEEALRVTRAQLWRLSAQHVSIQEIERRRIAVELHDGMGQILSLVKLRIDEAASSVDPGVTAKTRKSLQSLSSQVKSALDELRRIAMNLRPSTLDDLGIVATLSWYFREFEMLSPSMAVERDISVTESDVREPLKIAIFRIVQEATGNALKHANARRIKIRLTSTEEHLQLSIEDDGQGFDPVRVAGHHDFEHGIGLRSMKERAELSGGSYAFQSSPGQGTRISVMWPRVAESDPECPVIPMKQELARSMCGSGPGDDGLTRDFAVCLNCLRALRSDQPS